LKSAQYCFVNHCSRKNMRCVSMSWSCSPIGTAEAYTLSGQGRVFCISLRLWYRWYAKLSVRVIFVVSTLVWCSIFVSNFFVSNFFVSNFVVSNTFSVYSLACATHTKPQLINRQKIICLTGDERLDEAFCVGEAFCVDECKRVSFCQYQIGLILKIYTFVDRLLEQVILQKRFIYTKRYDFIKSYLFMWFYYLRLSIYLSI